MTGSRPPARARLGRAPRARLAMIVLACLPLPCRGQATRTYSMRADNDAFDFWMAPWNRPDDEYTSGVHMAYEGGDAPWWARRLLSGLPVCTIGSSACRSSRLEIGQDIYTPLVSPSGLALAVDRPNAGWLYISQGAQSLTDTRSDAFTLTLGVTGPPSLARFTQQLAHSAGPAYNRPTDWTRQLAFEPGAIARVEHAARIASSSESPLGVDVVPRVGASLGNVLTAADAGARARLGWRMSHPWLPPSGDFGLDVFAGASARAVAHDLFLDGNTFRSGPRVGHEPLVESGELGLEVHVRGLALGYRAVSDSRSYRTGPAWHAWGSMTASFTMNE